MINMDYSDVAGNLIIILRENGFDIKDIPYSLVDKFSRLLLTSFEEQNKKVMFYLNDEDVEDFLYFNKGYIVNNKESNCFRIINERPLEELYFKFQGSLTVEALDVISTKEFVLKTLKEYKQTILEENAKKVQMINSKIKELVNK